MDDETRKMLAQSSREIADQMAKVLRQEYRWHENGWWLFTLGEPARVLTEAEVKYARGRGLIPTEPKS